MEITESLLKELESELVEISNIKVGSQEHTAAVESANKLAGRIIEINKFESEREDKRALTEKENRLKEEEHKLRKEELELKRALTEKENKLKEEEHALRKEELELKRVELTNNRVSEEKDHKLKESEIDANRKSNWLRYGVAIGTTTLTLLTYWATYSKTMKYESEGIIPTTEPGRNSVKSLFNINRLLKF